MFQEVAYYFCCLDTSSEIDRKEGGEGEKEGQVDEEKVKSDRPMDQSTLASVSGEPPLLASFLVFL